MNDALHTLVAKFREHVEALDGQIALMADRQIRILHHNLDVTASSLEHAKTSRAELQAIINEVEQFKS